MQRYGRTSDLSDALPLPLLAAMGHYDSIKKTYLRAVAIYGGMGEHPKELSGALPLPLSAAMAKGDSLFLRNITSAYLRAGGGMGERPK